MIEEKKGYCSNKWEEMVALKGEKIKGIFRETKGDTTYHYIIFESGNGFCFTHQGAYWISKKNEVNDALYNTKEEIEKRKMELELINDMMGENHSEKG